MKVIQWIEHDILQNEIVHIGKITKADLVTHTPWLSSDMGTPQGFAPSQSETALLCNDASHWLGANLESALTPEKNLTRLLSPKHAPGQRRQFTDMPRNSQLENRWRRIETTPAAFPILRPHFSITFPRDSINNLKWNRKYSVPPLLWLLCDTAGVTILNSVKWRNLNVSYKRRVFG